MSEAPYLPFIRNDFRANSAPFASGTIENTALIEVTSPWGLEQKFVWADVQLDEPYDGQSLTNLVIFLDNKDIIGTRVQGKLLISDDDKNDVLSHGMSGHILPVGLMLGSGICFDFRTTQLMADDPTLRVIGNPVEANLKILGRYLGDLFGDYYRDHGFEPRPTERMERRQYGRFLGLGKALGSLARRLH